MYTLTQAQSMKKQILSNVSVMKIVCSLNTKLELIDYNLFEKTKK